MSVGPNRGVPIISVTGVPILVPASRQGETKVIAQFLVDGSTKLGPLMSEFDELRFILLVPGIELF